VIQESVGSIGVRVKSLKTKVNVGTLNETHRVKGRTVCMQRVH
jgi:hypothetical protein